jgi:TonB family protein
MIWSVRTAANCAALSFTLGASFLAANTDRPAALAPTLVEPTRTGDPAPPRISAERSGLLPTKDAQTLRFTTDLGSVRIVPLDPGAAPVVRYLAHLEADPRASQAQELLKQYSLRAKATSSGVEITGALPAPLARVAAGAQFWIHYVIAVPPGFTVEVSTGAGDIETQDIGGTANLVTQGGNIRTGRIGFRPGSGVSAGHAVAKLRTEGGHIWVADVAGDVNAFTAGGHISAGDISGEATLYSGGGHIHAEHIGGRAQLDTVGGNISVGQAGSLVSVRTGGGQIDFGEVHGSVRAQTAGGGIRVMYVSGPMEVESSGGSICLTRVAGSVRAATGNGTITAWINPDTTSSGGAVMLPGASQLSSGAGDIVVFLPRNLVATLEATIESGGEHHIEADSGIPLNVQSPAGNGSGAVHATGLLNGGGELLKLRTTAGKIRLHFLDSQIALRESLIRDQKERLAERFDDGGFLPVNNPMGTPNPPPVEFSRSETKGDWLDTMVDRVEAAFLGGVREDPDDFKKRITYSPHPEYPSIARRAGIQGVVLLQVRVGKDGHVEVEKLIEGQPALADAAMAAVKQWRAKPEWSNGKPVDVISTVSFKFQLH